MSDTRHPIIPGNRHGFALGSSESTGDFNRMVLDNLPVAIYMTDATGLLTYYNRAAAEFSGREPKLGSDKWCVTWKLFYPDGRFMPHEECPMARTLKKGRSVPLTEIIAERPDGKRLWFVPYPTPLFNKKGELTGGINMLLNVTEQKPLQFSDSLLTAIIEGSNDAIVSKNLSGFITSWNKSAEHMFGYNEDEAIGRPVTMLIPQDRMEEETVILDELKRGNPVNHFETVRLRKDGEELDVSLTISPVFDAAGKIIGASKIARDISSRKRVEEKIQKMNESLEERVRERTAALLMYQEQLKSLTSTLSKAEENERQRLATHLHDNLGQLLAIGKMKLDLLQNHELPEQTKATTSELADLMNGAITYTRELMSELKPPPSLEEESLAVNINWVVQQMKKHDLEVTVEVDDEPKKLPEDVRRTLCQCTRELLVNVVKHSGVEKAEIVISRVNNHVRLVVEDKGIGFQLSKKRPEPTKMGGFGLFNIYERMDWMGGRMEITAKPGRGTKIELLIPMELAGTENETAATGDRQTSESSQKEIDIKRKVRVLLADDHEMVRKGLRHLIEEQGDLLVIGEAVHGKEAVHLAHKMDPDVIVMDVNMPEMDGIEATKVITSNKLKARIIGLSLHDKEEVKSAMRNAGAAAYLTKTEAFESLSALIRSEGKIAWEVSNE